MPRNVTVSPREHDLLGMIAESNKQNASHCLEMASLRPDQRELWEKAAAMFKVLEGQIWDLATEGLLTRESGEYGGGKLS